MKLKKLFLGLVLVGFTAVQLASFEENISD